MSEDISGSLWMSCFVCEIRGPCRPGTHQLGGFVEKIWGAYIPMRHPVLQSYACLHFCTSVDDYMCFFSQVVLQHELDPVQRNLRF